MNGLLVLEGFVPRVDFPSRQVVYGYFLALFMQVVGVSFQAMRYYPVLATVAIGAFVYLIATRLFDHRVGLLAAGIYLFLPFTIVFGTHVKTEPLTILLSCVGLYALLAAVDRDRGFSLLLLSGAAFALAYYVRESSLAVLLASLIFLALVIRRPLPWIRAAALVVGGFVLVCAGIIGYYSTHLPLSEVLLGRLNPTAFVLEQFRDVLVQTAPEATLETADAPIPIDRSDQPWAVSLRNVRHTLALNSVLLVAFALSPLHLLGATAGPARRGRREEQIRAAMLLYVWIGTVAVAYAFWTLKRGFFPAYFGELLPPLAIVTAVTVFDAVGRLRADAPGTEGARMDIPDAGGGGTEKPGPGGQNVLLFGLLALGFLGLHAVLGPLAIHRPVYYVVVPAILGTVYLARKLGPRQVVLLAVLAAVTVGVVLVAGVLGGVLRLVLYGALLITVFVVLFVATGVDPRREPTRSGSFVSYSLVAATCMLWLGTSQAELDRRYDGVWSPEAIHEVASFLQERTTPTDEVLSGAVIWEFEARRLPFMLLSHPLTLRTGVSPYRRQHIQQRLAERPPAVIVLDGYTEQTYLRAVPGLTEIMARRYHLERVIHIEGARFPVQLFTRQADEEVPEGEGATGSDGTTADQLDGAPSPR